MPGPVACASKVVPSSLSLFMSLGIDQLDQQFVRDVLVFNPPPISGGAANYVTAEFSRVMDLLYIFFDSPFLRNF